VLGIIGIFFILYISKSILIPFTFAVLLAALLYPIKRFLDKKKVPETLSISMTLLIAIAVVAGVLIFIIFLVARVTEDFPRFQTQFSEFIDETQLTVEQKFGIQTEKQIAWIRERASTALEGSASLVGQTFLVITDILVIITLVPLYVFLLLLYKPLIVESIVQIIAGTSRTDSKDVRTVIGDTRGVIQNYLVGLLIETAVIAVISIVTLLLLGIDYAVLLGIIIAIINLIPYIGVLIGSVLPALVALITKESSWYALAVIGIFVVIQFVDGNIIMPRIVGSKVSLNALASIMGVLIGGLIWGLPGLFLALPIVAILKVIFDRSESLQPWGMLLGHDDLSNAKTDTANLSN